MVRYLADDLRRLHTDPEILVLVNVWDVASAKAVAADPRCRAIATASAAIAAMFGYPDGEHIPADLMLDMVGRIADAVPLPVTADLEAGYGDVDRTIRHAIQVGVVGANLEDQLRPAEDSVAAVRAAVNAAAAEGVPLVLNARTDAFLRGDGMSPDEQLTEAIRRGRAYLDAGADCVFVPGCTDTAAIGLLVAELGRQRVSILGRPGAPSPAELGELGVARVSYGPYPHRLAMNELSECAATAFSGLGLESRRA